MGLHLSEVKPLIHLFKQYFSVEIEIISQKNPSASYGNGCVTITSGLLDFLAEMHLDMRCLALLIAHEIAHHYQPKFWYGVNTREAEADFFAVCNLVIVWDKYHYIKNIGPAIGQFESYLNGKGRVPNVKERIHVMKAAKEFVLHSLML